MTTQEISPLTLAADLLRQDTLSDSDWHDHVTHLCFTVAEVHYIRTGTLLPEFRPSPIFRSDGDLSQIDDEYLVGVLDDLGIDDNNRADVYAHLMLARDED